MAFPVSKHVPFFPGIALLHVGISNSSGSPFVISLPFFHLHVNKTHGTRGSAMKKSTTFTPNGNCTHLQLYLDISYLSFKDVLLVVLLH